jgi:ABC-2 type transport system ATP-binding protein
MIHVENLIKKYGSFAAVDAISFDVKKGEVLGFLGPNGAGKTTTMKVLTNYISATSGKVEIDGLDVADHSLEIRKKIGYLPESNPIYEDLEVVEYLEFLSRLRKIPPAEVNKKIKRVIQVCNLGDVVGKDIGQLSKGFKQRLALAAAIVHDPQILILDEPTSGLDPNQIRDIRELIKELKKEKTLIISTHILSEVEASCDTVLIINKGKIAATGTTRELQSMVMGKDKIALKVKNGADAEGMLRNVPGVTRVQTMPARESGSSDFEIEYAHTDNDIRELLFREAVRNNAVILEMKKVGVNLETIFERLTKHE